MRIHKGMLAGLMIVPSCLAQQPPTDEEMSFMLSIMDIQDKGTVAVITQDAKLNRTVALMQLCGERDVGAILGAKIDEQTANFTEATADQIIAIPGFDKLPVASKLQILSMVGKSIEISIRAYGAGYRDAALGLLDETEEQSKRAACAISENFALDVLGTEQAPKP